ncbi:hypothetical protein [Adlercreutzia sp. ZJ473]|uniref:hypothetical protein n=1 Tax=Adlercreutzia sp. ZJ473 TaxID=2722822 RepID=UPI001552842B|nr:hypothetical protein [Adlercreutzia sp. ZJ473]
MRIWQDATGALITDEALVRYVAAYGSLGAAAAAGDVRLVERGREDARNEAKPAQCDQGSACADAEVKGRGAVFGHRPGRFASKDPSRRLKDYLVP